MEVDGDPRLSLLAPYDAEALQREFADRSPRAAYRSLSTQHRCKANPHVLAMLPSLPDGWAQVVRLDLARTYVGRNALPPLLQLCRRLSSLRTLGVADNYLENESIWDLAGMAMHHPSLRAIDLSRNAGISWSGGMTLAQAVCTNVQLTSIWLYQTSIPDDLAEGIFRQTRRNSTMTFVAKGGVRRPGDHARLIKLRAMHRFFRSIQAEDLCISREAVVDGFREKLHIEGKDLTACDDISNFRTALTKWEPPERVSWEAFIVLVMLEGVKYSSTLVSALRNAFLAFDVSISKTVNDTDMNGYVEVSSFADIYVWLYEQMPKEEDLTYLQSLLGLTSGQTVDWSEFLYIWYHRQLRTGERSIGSTLTPLPQTTLLWHY
ncbi:unnamed protein product [Phytomonas sp. Hart1]|nr:unnamed protein product [Phytomonas sp. Hart1]|eukprot:CCW67235.1 unnamed protein product [Phytomonas sp. isolate Hart1]